MVLNIQKICENNFAVHISILTIHLLRIRKNFVYNLASNWFRAKNRYDLGQPKEKHTGNRTKLKRKYITTHKL